MSSSFDVHGVCVEVHGGARNYFDSELWFYRKPCEGDIRVVEDNVGAAPFYELLSMREGRKYLHVPFADLDADSMTLRYERGLSPAYVFYIFESVLHLFLLKRDSALLHGAAFTLNDRGVWVTSWGGTGKTNILLYMISKEKSFGHLADDWAIIDSRGMIYAYPKRMRIYGYNLAAYPGLRLGGRLLHLKYRIIRALYSHSPSRWARILFSKLEPKLAVNPEELGLKVVPNANPALVVLMKKAPVSSVETFSVDREELIRSVSACVRYERDYFFKDYYRYLHYSGKPVNVLENHDAILSHVLEGFLSHTRWTGLYVPMKVGSKEAAAIVSSIREILETIDS